MNFKRQANKLELFLKEELDSRPPVAILENGSLAYKDFIIKQNKKEIWCLYRAKGFLIDKFSLKATSLMAAKLYSLNNFSLYNEIKILDSFYIKHHTDAVIFKHLCNKTKDTELKDLYITRFELSKSKSDYAKQQIANKFKALFDK
jgi:hypothetical protein